VPSYLGFIVRNIEPRLTDDKRYAPPMSEIFLVHRLPTLSNPKQEDGSNEDKLSKGLGTSAEEDSTQNKWY